MEHNNHHVKLLLVFSCILILSNPAQAKCIRRDSNDHPSSPSQPDMCREEDYASAPGPSSQRASPPTSNYSAMDDDEENESDSIQPSTSSGSSYATTPSGSPRKVDPALKKICDSTDYPDLCISSILPYFDGNSAVTAVLEKAIKASTQQTKIAIEAATKFANDPNTHADAASSLRDCKDDYNDALKNLQSALDAIPGSNTGTINTMLSAAVTDYGTCNDDFTGKNPIANFGETLINMASNCLAIASLINN